VGRGDDKKADLCHGNGFRHDQADMSCNLSFLTNRDITDQAATADQVEQTFGSVKILILIRIPVHHPEQPADLGCLCRKHWTNLIVLGRSGSNLMNILIWYDLNLALQFFDKMKDLSPLSQVLKPYFVDGISYDLKSQPVGLKLPVRRDDIGKFCRGFVKGYALVAE
jgi:hypothetical protein